LFALINTEESQEIAAAKEAAKKSRVQMRMGHYNLPGDGNEVTNLILGHNERQNRAQATSPDQPLDSC
jgi:hypothetical protein